MIETLPCRKGRWLSWVCSFVVAAHGPSRHGASGVAPPPMRQIQNECLRLLQWKVTPIWFFSPSQFIYLDKLWRSYVTLKSEWQNFNRSEESSALGEVGLFPGGEGRDGAAGEPWAARSGTRCPERGDREMLKPLSPLSVPRALSLSLPWARGWGRTGPGSRCGADGVQAAAGAGLLAVPELRAVGAAPRPRPAAAAGVGDGGGSSEGVKARGGGRRGTASERAGGGSGGGRRGPRRSRRRREEGDRGAGSSGRRGPRSRRRQQQPGC